MPSVDQKPSPLAAADAGLQIKSLIEKKIRNLEKRKSKLQSLKEDMERGKDLHPEQKKATEHIDEVDHHLDFSRDLLKSICQISQDCYRRQKNLNRRENRERTNAEMARLRQLLEMQDVLNMMGSDVVRKDFSDGTNNAVKLSKEELQLLDDMYEKICPSHDDLRGGKSWNDFLREAADHTYLLLNHSSKVVPNTDKTYKDFRVLLDKILNCGYFHKSSSGQQPSNQQHLELAKSETGSSSGNEDKENKVENQATDLRPEINAVPQTVEDAASFQQQQQQQPQQPQQQQEEVSSDLTALPQRHQSPTDVICPTQGYVHFLQDDQTTCPPKEVNMYSDAPAGPLYNVAGGAVLYAQSSDPALQQSVYPNGFPNTFCTFPSTMPQAVSVVSSVHPAQQVQVKTVSAASCGVPAAVADPTAPLSESGQFARVPERSLPPQVNSAPNPECNGGHSVNPAPAAAATVAPTSVPDASSFDSQFSKPVRSRSGRGRGGGFRGGPRGGINAPFRGRGYYGGDGYSRTCRDGNGPRRMQRGGRGAAGQQSAATFRDHGNAAAS